MPPLFTSFEDAWRWFAGGAEISPIGPWRDRFARGRGQLLSFQAPLGESEAADALLDFQDELADIDELVPFTRDMLHVSVLGVGFQVIAKAQQGDILRQDVERVAQLAATALRGVAPIEATLGPLNVFPDALILEVHDDGGLAEVRSALAAIVDDAFGLSDAQFLPHTTIAMFRSSEAAPRLRERLPELRDRPQAQLTIDRIELARWWFTGLEPEDLPERDPVREYRFLG